MMNWAGRGASMRKIKMHTKIKLENEKGRTNQGDIDVDMRITRNIEMDTTRNKSMRV
jgi:hypothetical protein